MKETLKNTNLMVKASLLVAFAVVLMYIDFPVLPAFAWLKIDFSEVPILIGAFAFGPVVGVIIEAIKNLLILLIKGTSTGGIGEVANFIVGAALVVPAALIYKKKKTRNSAILSLVVGTVSMTIIGALANLFVFVPIYSVFMPELKENSYIIKYLVAGVIPFNLIKGALVSIITILVYKRVASLIRKEAAMTVSKRAS